jgi:hypothetical protein
MNIETGTVWTFKLNSGEEMIAKVTKIEGEYLIVEEPVSVAPGPQGMGLVPSLFTADPSGITKLNTNSIAVFAPTDDNVRMKYIEATTGIKIPEKKLILG